MTPRRIEQLLWVTTSLVAIGGALVMRPQRLAGLMPPVRMVQRHRPAGPVRKTKSTTDQGRDIVAGDLFRRERQINDSAPWGAASQLTPLPPPAPPKPRLVLRGLVGGPPWQAILDGLPGHEGSYVARAGDSIGGLKIRSVRGDGATIRGMDTTWLLKLGRAP
jgi:hypothetical protein